jgi:hypothetical protein
VLDVVAAKKIAHLNAWGLSNCARGKLRQSHVAIRKPDDEVEVLKRYAGVPGAHRSGHRVVIQARYLELSATARRIGNWIMTDRDEPETPFTPCGHDGPLRDALGRSFVDDKNQRSFGARQHGPQCVQDADFSGLRDVKNAVPPGRTLAQLQSEPCLPYTGPSDDVHVNYRSGSRFNLSRGSVESCFLLSAGRPWIAMSIVPLPLLKSRNP